MSSTRSLNASFTSLVISKESGVILVHPDGQKLPENFEYMKPKNFDIRKYLIYGKLTGHFLMHFLPLEIYHKFC